MGASYDGPANYHFTKVCWESSAQKAHVPTFDFPAPEKPGGGGPKARRQSVQARVNRIERGCALYSTLAALSSASIQPGMGRKKSATIRTEGGVAGEGDGPQGELNPLITSLD